MSGIAEAAEFALSKRTSLPAWGVGEAIADGRLDRRMVYIESRDFKPILGENNLRCIVGIRHAGLERRCDQRRRGGMEGCLAELSVHLFSRKLDQERLRRQGRARIRWTGKAGHIEIEQSTAFHEDVMAGMPSVDLNQDRLSPIDQNSSTRSVDVAHSVCLIYRNKKLQVG